MNVITDIAQARLDRFQRLTNGNTVREQAKHIIACEDSLRYLTYCIEMGIPIDNDAVERAKALCET